MELPRFTWFLLSAVTTASDPSSQRLFRNSERGVGGGGESEGGRWSFLQRMSTSGPRIKLGQQIALRREDVS